MKNAFKKFFFAIISLPVLLIITGLDSSLQSENRTYKSFPIIQLGSEGETVSIRSIYHSIVEFKSEFESYFEDVLPVKKLALDPVIFLHRRLMGKNPLPLKTVEGEDGWMFLGNSFSHALDESLGISIFDDPELIFLKERLIHKIHFSDSLGIPYFIAVAPNKLSVYHRHLPIVYTPELTKFQQVRHLCEEIGIPLIDLSQGLGTEEDHYYKTDSHWTDLGAYIGYQNLIKGLRLSRVIPVPESRLSYFESQDEHDLIKMLNLQVAEISQEIDLLNPTFKKAQKQLTIPTAYNLGPELYEKRLQSKNNDIKVLIFRDSFTQQMEPFIGETFGESLFIWDHTFDKDLIIREKPDLVVHILIERNLEVLVQ